MSEWGSAVYDEPCRDCGFSWATGADEGVALVVDLPRSYSELLSGAAGTERHPDLDWAVGAYVCHVADNLRIWAERLAGVTSGARPEVAGYDENMLARARVYDEIPLEAALWSLGRAVADWEQTVAHARRAGVVLVHAERGDQTVPDVIVSNAHDACHHRWDIQRSLSV